MSLMKSLLLTAVVLSAAVAGAETPSLVPTAPVADLFEVGTPEAIELACRVVIPIVRNDSVTTVKNQAVEFNVLANDSNTSLGLAHLFGGRNGTAVHLGGGRIRYTPNFNFAGTDTLDYGVKACLQCFNGFCSEPDIRDGVVSIVVTP